MTPLPGLKARGNRAGTEKLNLPFLPDFAFWSHGHLPLGWENGNAALSRSEKAASLLGLTAGCCGRSHYPPGRRLEASGNNAGEKDW